MYIYVIIKSVAVIIIKKKKKKKDYTYDSLDTVSPGEGKRKKNTSRFNSRGVKKKKRI